jgi:serine/threonine protein kinase
MIPAMNAPVSQPEPSLPLTRVEPLVVGSSIPSGVVRYRGGGERRFESLADESEGGPGFIIKAYDRELDRIVALKRVHPKHFGRKDLETQLFAEARLTASLGHKSIPPVYALGNLDEGQPFFAMAFVSGGDLAGAIKTFHARRRTRDAGFADPTFHGLIEALAAAARAAGFAHGRNVVHLDIKPSNIMFGERGEFFLVDWGMARPLGFNSVDSGILGTPAFASPEQARRETPSATMDIFSLGATLFNILTGQPPFRDDSDATAERKARECRFESPAKLMPEAPAALVAICRKAMGRTADDRYPSAVAFASDLERWLKGEETLALPDGPVQGWIRRARRGPVLAMLLVLAAFTVAGWRWRYQASLAAERDAVRTELDRLLNANPAEVGRRLTELKELSNPGTLQLEVESRLEASSSFSPARLRLLAAIQRSPTESADTVVGAMVEVPTSEAPALLPLLSPRSRELTSALSEQFRGEAGDSVRRFRAGCWLAALASKQPLDGSFAMRLAEAFAETTVDEALASARFASPAARDLAPALEDRLRLESDAVRRRVLLAARLEMEPDPSRRIEVGLEFEPGCLAIVRERSEPFSDSVRARLVGIVDDFRRHTETSGLDDRSVRRVANAAALLAAGGNLAPLPLIFTKTPDPRVRTLLARSLAAAGARADQLVTLLEGLSPREPLARMYLLLALGEFESGTTVSALTRADMLAEQWFVTEPSPALHSACEWWLRHRGRVDRLRDLTKAVFAGPDRPHARWIINEFGATLIRIGADRASAAESFWIASRELSVEEHARAIGLTMDAERSDRPLTIPGPFAARHLCNELSQRVGLQPVYGLLGTDSDADSKDVGAGYRLPTNREWERACLAGATTPLPFASDLEVRRRMIRCQETDGDRPGAVGRSWPNEDGLFDMLGGVSEFTGSRSPDGSTVSIRSSGWSARLAAQRPDAVQRVGARSMSLEHCGIRLVRSEVGKFP